MNTELPGKSTSREIAERVAEAGLSAVPIVGGALAVAFEEAVGYRINKRREEWIAGLAAKVDDLLARLGGADFAHLTDDPRFVDAVVMTTRTVDHTHQEEKLEALRNAVLNSVSADAPDADTQAILLGLLDRLTASHLRFLTLWNDPRAWFEERGLTPLPSLPGLPGSRIQTVEAGMPETKGRQDFIRMLSYDLNVAGLMTAEVDGMVSQTSRMDRLTSELGTQLVHIISRPGAPDEPQR